MALRSTVSALIPTLASVRVPMAAAAAIASLLVQPAGAQPVAAPVVEQGTGFYATLGLGAGWPQSQTTSLVDPFDGRYVYNGGFAGDAGIGYDFGALRAEITYAFNSNPNPYLDFNGGRSDIEGTPVRLNSGYLSLYWDLPLTPRIIPYIGGGIGGTNYSYGAGTVGGESYKADGVGTFAYQAKAGVTYVVSRRADLYVEGTYQGGAGYVLSNENYGPINVWGAKAGLRWRFAGAPAVVAAAPEPAPVAPEPAPVPVAPEPAPTPAPIRGLW